MEIPDDVVRIDGVGRRSPGRPPYGRPIPEVSHDPVPFRGRSGAVHWGRPGRRRRVRRGLRAGEGQGRRVKQLIPGTEDYYYYHGLYYLKTEQFEKAEALWKPWHDRFGQTARLTEIQTRHALLTYPKNPQKTLEYLRHRLNVRYDHQRIVPRGGAQPADGVDQDLIARADADRRLAGPLGQPGQLRGRGPRLARRPRSSTVDRGGNSCSSGCSGPTSPNLCKLVADDLAAPNSLGVRLLHHPPADDARPARRTGQAPAVVEERDELRRTPGSPSCTPGPTRTGGTTRP